MPPLIDYKCLECEKEYEVFYKTHQERQDEERLQPCPQCNSIEKEQLVSKDTSFILNGSGWARDKYGG